jgi:serine/threonine-protein kinase
LKTEPQPLAWYAPDVTAELGRIVTKALMKDREQRYQVIGDLLVDLKSVRHEQDISAERKDLGAHTSNLHSAAVNDAKTVAIENTVAQPVGASTRSMALERKTGNGRLFLAAVLLALVLAGLTWYLLSHRNESEANLLASLVTTRLVDWKSDLGEDLSNWARFSPDGKWLAYHQGAPQTGEDLWTAPVERTTSEMRLGKPQPLLVHQGQQRQPSISPDGHWLAYESNESGQPQIYVRPFPNVDTELWPISANGGTRPVWARNGKELFYLGLDGRLMAVDVNAGSTLSTGPPRALFQTGIRTSGFVDQYCPASDGQRFFLADPVDQAPDAITVVVNWTAGVRV